MVTPIKVQSFLARWCIRKVLKNPEIDSDISKNLVSLYIFYIFLSAGNADSEKNIDFVYKFWFFHLQLYIHNITYYIASENLLAEATKAIQRYPWNVQSNSMDVMHMVVASLLQMICNFNWNVMSHGFDFCRALPFSSGAGNVSYTPASLLPGSGVTKSKLLYCYRRLLKVQCGEPRRLVWRKF